MSNLIAHTKQNLVKPLETKGNHAKPHETMHKTTQNHYWEPIKPF